jgi:hypothetical protein
MGRKQLKNLLDELAEAGYLDRDEHQGRDEHNRFLPYDYTVRDVPEFGAIAATAAPAALRPEPQREKDTGNNKKRSIQNPQIPSPNPFPRRKPNLR